MVELVQGHVIQERRGGAGILSSLVAEMAKLFSTGYIRLERTPSDSIPRVGQLLINNGAFVAAIHEEKAIREGLDALLEIETDSLELDCRIQVVEGVDMAKILDLHPNSLIEVESPEEGQSGKWWQDIKTRPRGWTRSSRLPEIKPTEEAPEFIQRQAAAMIVRASGTGQMLRPGAVHLLNDADGSPMFSLAANLANHGRPLLVMSRIRREELVVAHSLDAKSCLTLSQSDGEGVQFVDLDAIMGTIRGFLEINIRAVIMLEGLEYLAATCGLDETLAMLRDLCDIIRMEDHCLLMTADLSAFKSTNSSNISRVAPSIARELIGSWLEQSDILLDHPLLAPLNEEELLRLERHIEETLPPQLESTEIEAPEVMTISIPQPEIVVEEASVEEIIIVEEQLRDVVEDTKPLPPRPPRKAQRVSRRKSSSPPSLSDGDVAKSSISAMGENEISAKMPVLEVSSESFGEGRTGEFDEIPGLIPNTLSDHIRQPAFNRSPSLPETSDAPKPLEAAATRKEGKAIASPLDARGIEIELNTSNRSQSSSIPQRKIDIDAELRTWRKPEEGPK
jgi:hypothetical protein